MNSPVRTSTQRRSDSQGCLTLSFLTRVASHKETVLTTTKGRQVWSLKNKTEQNKKKSLHQDFRYKAGSELGTANLAGTLTTTCHCDKSQNPSVPGLLQMCDYHLYLVPLRHD